MELDLTDAIEVMKRVSEDTWGSFAADTGVDSEDGRKYNWYRPGIAESRDAEFAYFKADLAEGKPLAISHFAQFIAWRMNRGQP